MDKKIEFIDSIMNDKNDTLQSKKSIRTKS